MQADEGLREEWESEFQKINDGQFPRPEAFGYSRVARQIHKVEEITTRLYQVMARNPRFPLPKEPLTAYERWLNAQQDDEFGDLLGDIFKANPKAFGMN